ncbi:hypothetical protein ACQY0O_004167 [Thecaphora frezii]
MKSSLVSLLLVLGCVTTASAFSFTKHKDFTKVKTVEKLGDIGLLTVKHGTSTKHHICLKPSQDLIDAAENKDFSFFLYLADKNSNEFSPTVVEGTPWDERLACVKVDKGSQILHDFEHDQFHRYKLELSGITWKKGMEPKKVDPDQNAYWLHGWIYKPKEDGMNVYQL